MNPNSRTALWVPFVVASLFTLLVYVTSWTLGPYWLVLSMLGILSVGLAIRVLAHTGPEAWAIAGVVVGLIVGQWWALELGAMQLLWGIRGFAP
jgi:hypothetical protein